MFRVNLEDLLGMMVKLNLKNKDITDSELTQHVIPFCWPPNISILV